MAQRAIVSVQWRQSPPPPCNLLADQKRGIRWQHISMMAINHIIKLTALSRYTFVDKLNHFGLSATSSNSQLENTHTHLFVFVCIRLWFSWEFDLLLIAFSARWWRRNEIFNSLDWRRGQKTDKIACNKFPCVSQLGFERRCHRCHTINSLSFSLSISRRRRKEKQQLWCTLTYYSVRGLNLK